jgi:single-strand DNA-binding protein
LAGETIMTVVGNLVADPEIKFTPSGAAVANFTVASTPRSFDKDSGQWKDQPALFMRCSIWRQPAENVVESLSRGDRVIVQGRLTQRSYETAEGEKRSVVELLVDEIGPSLRYATVKVSKVAREGDGGNRTRQRRPDGSSWPSDDPWGSTPSAATGPAAPQQDEQPPF